MKSLFSWIVLQFKLYILVPLLIWKLTRSQSQPRRHSDEKVDTRLNLNGLHYDPDTAKSLHLFAKIKNQTPCMFAKASKLQGAPEWNHWWDITENTEALKPALENFVVLVREGRKLDGFVIPLYHENLHDILAFARAVKETLSTMTAWSEYDCMKVNRIRSTRWQFQVLGLDFFVTTFSPCYPKNHPRYNEGVKDCAFILLQPMESFLWKNLPIYKTEQGTDYSDLQSLDIREQIRLNFCKRGQKIYVPPHLSFPMVDAIVPPMDKPESTIVYWWLDNPFVGSI